MEDRAEEQCCDSIYIFNGMRAPIIEPLLCQLSSAMKNQLKAHKILLGGYFLLVLYGMRGLV